MTKAAHAANDGDAAADTSTAEDRNANGDRDADADEISVTPQSSNSKLFDQGQSTLYARRIQAGQSVLGSVINGNVYFTSANGRVAPLLDRNAFTSLLSGSYVESRMLSQIRGRLEDESRIVLVLGAPGIGKRSASLVAAHLQGYSRVLEMSPSLGIDQIIETLKTIDEKKAALGTAVVIPDVDSALLDHLDEYRAFEIKSAIGTGSRVIFTADSKLLSTSRDPTGLVIVKEDGPTFEDLVEVISAINPAGEDEKHRLLQLGIRVGAVGYLDVRRLSGLMDIKAGHDDETVASAYLETATAERLQVWFAKSQTMKEVARLAVAATMESLPRADTEALSDRLAAALGDKSKGERKARFRLTTRDDGLLTSYEEVSVRTHFGRRSELVSCLAYPLIPENTIQYLWENLDERYRNAYVDWLFNCANSSNRRVRAGAATAAGVLLLVDPVRIERHLLRGWSLAKELHLNQIAAFAVGVPQLLAQEADVGRSLVRAWLGSANAAYTRTALLAFGGPFGAWDDSLSAPAILWDLWRLFPEYENLVCAGLSNLVTSSPQGRQIRSAVVALLKDRMAADQRDRQRAFRAFVDMSAQLFARGSLPEACLTAASSPAERPTWSDFLDCTTTVWTSPDREWHGVRLLQVVCASRARGTISNDFAFGLIRDVKHVARQTGVISTLGDNLRRSLQLLARRSRDPTYLNPVRAQFFPSLKEFRQHEF